MIERGDEHRGTPYSAVQRSAWTVRSTANASKFRLEDHRGAVRHAPEVADDHAEAVIKRHGDAYAIFGREVQGLADEEAVVEDVVVRQRGALGCAGRAGRELNVDRVVELKPRSALGQSARSSALAGCDNSSKFNMPDVSPCRAGSRSERRQEGSRSDVVASEFWRELLQCCE